jgi:hypothetical protein
MGDTLIKPPQKCWLSQATHLKHRALGADASFVDERATSWSRVRTPWGVSLIISGVIILPQVLLGHYRGGTGFLVFFAVLQWLALALILRFVVFMADRVRRA